MYGTERLDAYHLYDREWESYDQLRAEFEWEIPDRFNMAEYVCERWAEDRGRVAMFAEDADGNRETYTFRDVNRAANRLANYLADAGVGVGDRVGVNLPTTPETLVSHVAAWKLGAVSMPLSTTFGPDGLSYRLNDCDAAACVVHDTTVGALREATVDVDTVLLVGDGDAGQDEAPFWPAIEDHSRRFETEPTTPDQDAFILYTSGTTGDPKGVLHGHELVLGNLPQFVTTTCNLELNDDDLFWMPVEWSWIAIFAAVVPAMFFGRPVLGAESRQYDPERVFDLVDRYELTNLLFPPTALRMLQQVDRPAERYDLSSVRLVMTAGERIGEDLVDWTADVFGDPVVHEGYGQTEAHYIIGDCAALQEPKAGWMGHPEPGHDVTLVDVETAAETVEPGEVGEIALAYEGDPLAFKEYWKNPEKTASVRTEDGWHLTGDLAVRDEDGYFQFVSRKDDVIISSGYRIGPEEIENALEEHPAVENAGVIGVPDEERGTVPKAFVVLSAGTDDEEATISALQERVKADLAKHEYPRAVEVVDELPLTQTGKTQRSELREREGL